MAEADQPPRVEIFGPADRLELPTPRPIEVGFSAGDDFGLEAVDLVYRVDDGPEQRMRLKDAGGGRSAQGKTVFEPNLESSSPGVIVAYRIEARDNDAISPVQAAAAAGKPAAKGKDGKPAAQPAAATNPARPAVGKPGSSRTLYVVIQDPRENLDEQILRERDVLDKLLDNLADRLEALEVPPAAGRPVGGSAGAAGAVAGAARGGGVAGGGAGAGDRRRAAVGQQRQAGAGGAVLHRRPAEPAAARGVRAAGRAASPGRTRGR